MANIDDVAERSAPWDIALRDAFERVRSVDAGVIARVGDPLSIAQRVRQARLASLAPNSF
jgi:hypothetical protein